VGPPLSVAQGDPIGRASSIVPGEVSVSAPLRHLSEDLLRAHAVGAASEGAGLVASCHISLCPVCEAGAAEQEAVLDTLLGAVAVNGAGPPPPALRARLLADVSSLPPLPPPPAARSSHALPADLPPLPAPLTNHLAALDDVAWHTLFPGLRAIDLRIGSAWRARLVCFRPGIPIPLHDHEGPEHTVVFAGGLDDADGHLGRGDAATMLPGHAHSQRASLGEPCVALIVSEAPPRPLTLVGRVMKRITRS
jgi:putative transcriptional regulator